MSKVVLDASAVVALLRREPGAELVAEYVPDAIISAVNYAEVASRMADEGYSDEAVEAALDGLDLEIVPFDRVLALIAGGLRRSTRHLGLSLGDRACLALALTRGQPALTADRDWTECDVGVEVKLIR